MSDLSKELHNAYFTGNTEVRTLLHYADQLWNLEGKVALEPSVGSGAFPLTAERLGYYNTFWVTNELFPKQTNFAADHNRDFFELEPEPVDLVLGNPPYTGSREVDGRRLPLWLAFVHQSFKWADQVAFVLPLQALKHSNLSRLPEGVEVVGWTPPAANPFVLGGVGASEEKEVRTATVFLERTGFAGYQYDTEPPEGLEWVATGHPEATHGVSLVGSLGEARCLKKSWGRRFPFCPNEPQVKVTAPDLEALLASNFVDEFASNLCSALPVLSKEELNFYLKVARKQLSGTVGKTEVAG